MTGSLVLVATPIGNLGDISQRARDALAAQKLSKKGKLYAYSIVHRSFPGVEVPYISAIVDLEGGGTISIAHCDLKPENVIIVDGHWEEHVRTGIARLHDEMHRI